MPKVKGHGNKTPVKPKDLSSLSSDEDHLTPSVDVPIITSTPVELSLAEPPAKKKKNTRQLTVDGRVVEDESLSLKQEA